MKKHVKLTMAAAAMAGASLVASAPAQADSFGFSFGPRGGVGFSYDTGGYCDSWGCPDGFLGLSGRLLPGLLSTASGIADRSTTASITAILLLDSWRLASRRVGRRQAAGSLRRTASVPLWVSISTRTMDSAGATIGAADGTTTMVATIATGIAAATTATGTVAETMAAITAIGTATTIRTVSDGNTGGSGDCEPS